MSTQRVIRPGTGPYSWDRHRRLGLSLRAGRLTRHRSLAGIAAQAAQTLENVAPLQEAGCTMKDAVSCLST